MFLANILTQILTNIGGEKSPGEGWETRPGLTRYRGGAGTGGESAALPVVRETLWRSALIT
jgi:hypothetical protein